MSDLQRSGGRRPTRRQKEQRAFQLAVGGGVTGVLGGLGLVLAIAGVMGGFWPVVLLLVSVACFFGFKRTVG